MGIFERIMYAKLCNFLCIFDVYDSLKLAVMPSSGDWLSICQNIFVAFYFDIGVDCWDKRRDVLKRFSTQNLDTARSCESLVPTKLRSIAP